MKVYIAGKITGDPYYKAKFARAAADIAVAGHTPINPAMQPEGMEAEQLQRIWREVEALSESVRDGYVSAPDLIRVLRDEYEIDIIGG